MLHSKNTLFQPFWPVHAYACICDVHMYSMPYYTYGSTANFLFLGPTVLLYINQKNGAVMRIYVVLENLKLNK